VTIQEAAKALRKKTTSSIELTRDSLRGIARLDPTLRAFITITEEVAEAQATQADQELAGGVDRGPLHGIPIAVKDVFSTRGIRTTCGSKLFADFIPARDATVVERLKAAGAVIVGKTNMHELAYGITSTNPHFGTVRNPWDLERIPGGSSGGSGSAVAAGLVFMAMGSDTGGSIRIPASFCGIVGLKPTFGRVSRYGVMPLDFSLDHMGPLTRSVRDAALTLDTLAGFDPRDDTSSRQPVEPTLPSENSSIQGVRIGLPESFYLERVAPAVAESVRRAATLAEQAGAVVVPVRLPDIANLNTVGRIILLCEASATMERYLARREDFGTDVLALLDQGRLIPATDYINAQRIRRVLRQEFQSVWKQVDCLFTPTTPTGAPKIGQTTLKLGADEEDVRIASTRLVRGINVLGIPALSMLCGFDEQGLPLGLQIIGRGFQEALILRVGAVIEDALDLRRRSPSL
jgi:aspartyl-tRNA(Asn)/glutamyl-tRNA(Gln) amidotransferase subunit A